MQNTAKEGKDFLKRGKGKGKGKKSADDGDKVEEKEEEEEEEEEVEEKKDGEWERAGRMVATLFFLFASVGEDRAVNEVQTVCRM